MYSVRKLVFAVGLATAVLAGSGTALADPPPGTQPGLGDIVAVGSDTVQYLCDQFSVDYNADKPPAHPLPPYLYCWNAVNPTTGLPGDTITSKGPVPPPTNPCTMTRPNGSGAGIAQLQKKIKTSDGVHYCVDMARSSRNIKPTDGTGIASVLFATDLITYATVSGGNGVSNLTDTDLTAIYECNASLINSSFPKAPVTWKEVGGTSADAIVPILPQSSSGIRQQWQADINVSNAQLGSCVINGVSPVDSSIIQENEGINSVFTSRFAFYKDDLVPYSAGVYVCQVYTKMCPDLHGNLVLGDIDGKSPLTSTHTINVSGLNAFPDLYVRGLYFVVLNAGTASAPKVPTSPTNLVPLLGQGNSSGWVCGVTGQSDTKSFGFAVPSNCGALTG